jgi:hypothetical protein
MWPFTKKGTAMNEKVERRPFGAQVGKLTRFGNTWIDIDEISIIEFDPPDGGCR